MEKTLLFAGYYNNVATLVQVEGFEFFYNIPLAYLIVAFFYFFISLILIVRKCVNELKFFETYLIKQSYLCHTLLALPDAICLITELKLVSSLTVFTNSF